MALATAMISSPQLRYCPSPRARRRRRGRHSPAAATVAASATPRSEENIVIVGAGVAGLATAVALRRLGVGAAVLEQGDALRAGGTSLTLFNNGWRVLNAIGVADELRSKYLRIQGCVPLPSCCVQVQPQLKLPSLLRCVHGSLCVLSCTVRFQLTAG